jgi:hypothetical protein
VARVAPLTAKGQSPSVPHAAQPAAKPAPVVRGPAVTTSQYSTYLQTTGRYAAGEAGSIVAVVVAKGDYKCNDKYPTRFTAVRAEGVAVSPTVVKGSLTGKTGSLTIPVRVTKAGPASVRGELKFSVCSEERCLLEKQELALDFEVK